MAEKRKLASILAADVVGFSLLHLAPTEDRTFARLPALRSDLIDPLCRHTTCVQRYSAMGRWSRFAARSMRCDSPSDVQNAMLEQRRVTQDRRRSNSRIGISCRRRRLSRATAI